MTLLALEFSSDRRSVALARDGKVLAEAVEQTAGRGTKAFTLIESALAQTGLSREEIEVIAVGLGPGSYTGIRAAIAIAQGWQLATGVKLMGVSSAEAIAVQALSASNLGKVQVVIDAQRGEFYQATWEIMAGKRMETSPLKIVSGEVIATLQAAGEPCVGPEMPDPIHPAAATVAVLASHRSDFIAGETLEPIYLRETSFVKAAPARVI